MPKAPDAFRTISEVSDWLDTPAHVLRFWESKFTQVRPVKRAGGRRYYRPDDMRLLAGIKVLLHEQGMTIKGAQKLLRENGVKYAIALSPPLDDEDETGEVFDTTATVADAQPETAHALRADPEAPETAPEPEPVSPELTLAGAELVPADPDPETRDIAPEPEPEPDIPEAATEPPAPVMAMPPPTLTPTPQPEAPPPSAPEQKSWPAEPPAPPPAEPRALGWIGHLRDGDLSARAAEIAPLLHRLEALRDHLRRAG